MRGPGRTAVGLVVASTLVVGLTTTAVATPVTGATAAETPAVAADPVHCPTEVLEEPVGGAEAVDALGDRGLAEVGRRIDEDPDELREHLETDPALHVGTCGRLFWVDPMPDPAAADHHATHDHGDHAAHLARPDGVATADGGFYSDLQPVFPLTQTFQLQSRPGSDRTIFLDFRGQTLSGTAWNHPVRAPDGYVMPPFSVDADTSTFSRLDHAFIQSIWQRVAEDFAPFDVNVTTRDPGLQAIRRTNRNDEVYGTRALITNDTGRWARTCDCVGMAHDDVFDVFGRRGDGSFEHDFYQPGSINLTGATSAAPYGMAPLEYGPGGIADTISHEVGHNFSLQHHGRNADAHGYHPGQGLWAPIMGGGDFGRPLQQWSNGDYGDYNGVGLDDVATIAAKGAPLVSDDHGRNAGNATVLTGSSPMVATGVIGDRNDRDWFRFQASGLTTIAVTAPSPGPNLDAELRLYDADGSTLRATVDPASYLHQDEDKVGGLDAVRTLQLPAGTYHARIRGVGSGNPLVTGYSDYGSLGRYDLTVTAGGPDLRVPQLVDDLPEWTLQGDSFEVTDRTRNHGVAAAGDSVTRYYLSTEQEIGATSRRLAGVRRILTLRPGAFDHGTTTVTSPIDLPAGMYWLAACADDTRLVTETNENNNCRWSTSQIEIVARPNLRVVRLTDPPASIEPGATMRVTDRTRNVGVGWAWETRTRYYLTAAKNLDGARRLAGARQVPDLHAGDFSQGSRNVTVPSDHPTGAFWLAACADDFDEVPETNEDDNCRWSTTQIQVGAAAR